MNHFDDGRFLHHLKVVVSARYHERYLDKDPEAKRKHGREYNRRRYNEDADYRKAHLAVVAAGRDRSRARLRDALLEYLRTHPCVDCGESDPVVLDFDHVRGVKVFNISNAVRQCCSVETLLGEIAKCEVRCANCHRRRTAKVLGHWKVTRSE